MQRKKIMALYFLSLGMLTTLIVMTALMIKHSGGSQQHSAQSTLVSTIDITAGQGNDDPYESARLDERQAEGQPGYPNSDDPNADGTLSPFEDDAHAPGTEPDDSGPSYVYNPMDATSQAAGLGSYDDLTIPRGSEPYDSAYPGPGYTWDGSNDWGSSYPGPQNSNPTATATQAVTPVTAQPSLTSTQAATVAAPTATVAVPTATVAAPTATTARTATPSQAAPAATAAPTGQPSPLPSPTPPIVTGENGSKELVSVRAEASPVVDGDGSDTAWVSAPELALDTQGGANASATHVSVRSVHDGDSVYFLFQWTDPTQSWQWRPWELQPDGSWMQLSGPETRGNDENTYSEDKLALFWPMGSDTANFRGCGTACHSGENADAKPYGNMYTPGENAVWDVWQWKSVRNAGQVDDQYLDNQAYTQDTPAAGFHPDPDSGGGYTDNRQGDLPAFMLPNGGDRSGAPGFISDSEKTAFDPSLFQPGDRLPGVISAPFAGDRGDVQAGWRYADGAWTLEIRRKLVTGSAVDVQFDDFNRAYPFGLATFDNAQVRHAYEDETARLKFEE